MKWIGNNRYKWMLKIEKDPFHLYAVVKKMQNRNLLRIIEKDMNSECSNKMVLYQMTLDRLNPLGLNPLMTIIIITDLLDQLLHKKILMNEWMNEWIL